MLTSVVHYATMHKKVVMVMTEYEAQELFEPTNRELLARGEEPVDASWFELVLAEYEERYHERRDAGGLADLAVELRGLYKRFEEFGIIRGRRPARVSEVTAPPWWRLYCYRVSEPYLPLRAEVRERLGLEEPLELSYLGVWVRTAFAHSQLYARTIPNNDYAVLRFPTSSAPGVARIARLALSEQDAAMLRAHALLSERLAGKGRDAGPPPKVGEPEISPLWWLWRHAAKIAQETGAAEEAAVAFLVCDEPLVLPWLEVRTVEYGARVGFELSVGTPAVSPEAVASAYAAAVTECGQEPPEGSAIEEPAVELVIAYEEALKRFPKGRGPANKGVKKRRVESLPEHVRAHYGQDAETVDKLYHRKVKMLPEELRPRGGDAR